MRKISQRLPTRFGGVLLIGANENNGSLDYPGLNNQSASEVVQIYEHAAKKCSPCPVINPIPITIASTGAELVAVNIEPFIEQPIAAKAGTRNRSGNEMFHDMAWVFPMRVSSQTIFVEPEKLPMYMNKEVRRAFLLVSSIPEDRLGNVKVYYHGRIPVQYVQTRQVIERLVICETELKLEDLSVEKNIIELKDTNAFRPPTCRVPFLDIIDVWEMSHTQWALKLSGEIQQTSGNLSYVPYPR